MKSIRKNKKILKRKENDKDNFYMFFMLKEYKELSRYYFFKSHKRELRLENQEIKDKAFSDTMKLLINK